MAISPAKQFTIFLSLFVAALCAACSPGVIKALSDLNAIRNHMNQKYHDEVAVNLNNSKFLVVQFINSPLNKLGRAERYERAQDAAQFVVRNYEGIKSIERIWIGFVATETHFIFFHKTSGLDFFSFDKNGRSSDEGAEADDRKPVIKFNPARNETDISLTRVQLTGDMNDGIAMVPHYTVTGDSRQNGAAAPAYVYFDFASYSQKPRFLKSPDLEIYFDGRLVLQGHTQLLPSSASGSDETVAQFFKVRMPSKVFQWMAASRQVRIVLGASAYELTPDDIKALAAMSAQVSSSPPA